MSVAQKLYEGINIGSETTGLITYMRTDGVQLGQEAISNIGRRSPRSRGPAICRPHHAPINQKRPMRRKLMRPSVPTDIMRKPDDIARFLNDDQRRLYELIWKRTIASQMQSAELDQTGADIVDADGKCALRATGSVIVFDGFLSVYREDRDETDNGAQDDDKNRILPPMASGDPIRQIEVKPEQHFTQPPPRYTDASLVKRMEELGIGRRPPMPIHCQSCRIAIM